MSKSPKTFPPRSRRAAGSSCTDPVVGNILAGWRFDISGVSPAMRTDYEEHFGECGHCRRRQRGARSIDVLLLSIGAFVLAAIVIHRVEMIAHIGTIHLELHHTAIAISLEAVAIAGIAISALLWILVAGATPLPSLVGSYVGQHLPADLRERYLKRAA